VPCITGFIKPIILLPFSISGYLTADEIEAILLHELAHVKRNDYLLNFVQQVISIILFFNPFTRLINKLINKERENCCDDVVVHITGSPFIYAQALLKLEENKQSQWQLALAAIGKRYELLNRIERIMKTEKQTTNIRPALIALFIFACGISSIAWLNPKIEHGKISVKLVTNPIANIIADTPRKAKPKTTTSYIKAKPIIKRDTNKHVAMNNRNDAELEKLKAEVEKHGKAVAQHYESPEFKKLQEELEKQSNELSAYYNRPEIKQLQKVMEMQSARFDKLNDNSEVKALQKQMDELSYSMDKYYNNPKYKNMQKELDKSNAKLNRLKEGTPEFQTQRKRVAELGKQFNEYNQSAEIKQKQQQIREIGKSMREYYDSPEYVKQRDALKAYGESIRKVYQDPQLMQQQQELRKMSQQMRDYQKDTDMVQRIQALKEAQKQLNQYLKSPEFQKHMQEGLNEANAWINDQVRMETDRMKENITRDDIQVRKEAPGPPPKSLPEHPKTSEKPNLPEKPE
jgi:hypothetical protein